MVEVRGLKDAQKIENRIYVNLLATPDLTSLEAIAIVVWNNINDQWLGSLPNDVTINAVVATSMEVEEGPQFIYAPAVLTGADASGAMPNSTTICLSLRSDQRGRSARGRLYWLGLPRDGVVDNTVASDRLSAIVSALNLLRAAIETAGYEWSIVSFIHNGVPRVGGPVYFVVENVIAVDNTIDSQRRRLPGRGT
jgi:hypothetical protein